MDETEVLQNEAKPTVVSPADAAMVRYDAQMSPFLRRLSGIGLITEHILLSFAQAQRSALLAAFGEDQPPTEGESLDIATEQAKAKEDERIAAERSDPEPEPDKRETENLFG